MARTSLRGSKPQCSSRVSRLRWSKRGIFRLVDLAANESDHVGGTLDASEARIEHKLCHTRCRLDLGLKNVRLQRVHQALPEQLGRHLIRHRLSSFVEHLVAATAHVERTQNAAVLQERDRGQRLHPFGDEVLSDGRHRTEVLQILLA